MINKRTLGKKKSPKIKNTIFILGGCFCVAASLILSSSWNTRILQLIPSSSPPSSLNMLLQSALRTRSGDGWNIVDFSGDVHHDENPHGFQCEWTLFRSTSGNEANMCVHPFHDIVSNAVRKNHRWHDCDVLPKYWHENNANNSKIYVEIGGNIGTCVMEMLLSTDAPIIAFEPNPRNIFVLKETLRKMDKSYQERIVIVPVALGDEKGSNKIYAASNNMGNSVVGKVIKDFQRQEFSENNQFDIRVEKLEDILKPGPEIGLVKMDAQGYECRIVKGFGNEIAAKMGHIHFEIAPKWQKQQGCFDLCQRLRDYGFQIWRGGKIVEGEPGGSIFDVDAIKPKK